MNENRKNLRKRGEIRARQTGNGRETGRKLTPARLYYGPPGDDNDIRYLTGFHAPDAVALVCAGRRRTLIVRELEAGRARAEAPGCEILTPGTARRRGAKTPTAREMIAGALKQCGAKRVEVTPAFPLDLARWLERRGIGIRVAAGTGAPGRAVKSAEEIRRIAESQTAAVAAVRAVCRQLAEAREGRGRRLKWRGRPLTVEALRRTADAVLLAHDCLCEGMIVAPGPQAANPHERGCGPVRAGEPIVIDIFPRHRGHGYWGDITRTAIKGTPDEPWGRLHAAVRAAQAAALRKIRPGGALKEVHRAAARELERRGFPTPADGPQPAGFIHGTGHGVGLAIHEEPGLRNAAEGVLRARQVVTVEPGYYLPGRGGVRIEDTVVVTRRGYRVLATLDRGWRPEDLGAAPRPGGRR